MFCFVLFAKKIPLIYVVLLFSITLIQLVEYFMHKSITERNSNMNEWSTKLLLIILFLQPIAYSYINTRQPLKIIHNNNYGQPIMFIYVLIFICMYIYFNTHHVFKTTYLNPCNTVCRLKWFNLKGLSGILIILFFVFYITLFGTFDRDPRFKYRWCEYFIPASLALACIYAFILAPHDIFSAFSYMGSLWCFLAVFFGPFMLLTYR